MMQTQSDHTQIVTYVGNGYLYLFLNLVDRRGLSLDWKLV